jgi:hypothetical protein
MLPQLNEFVRDMLEKNFVKPNPGTTFSAPMLVIKKPPNADGTSRGFRMVTKTQTTKLAVLWITSTNSVSTVIWLLSRDSLK